MSRLARSFPASRPGQRAAWLDPAIKPEGDGGRENGGETSHRRHAPACPGHPLCNCARPQSRRQQGRGVDPPDKPGDDGSPTRDRPRHPKSRRHAPACPELPRVTSGTAGGVPGPRDQAGGRRGQRKRRGNLSPPSCPGSSGASTLPFAPGLNPDASKAAAWIPRTSRGMTAVQGETGRGTQKAGVMPRLARSFPASRPGQRAASLGPPVKPEGDGGKGEGRQGIEPPPTAGAEPQAALSVRAPGRRLSR
ncbi:hypothetical protein FHS53_000152 [Xanthobacter tagetidis]|nr:hypothetical protein [Xanthobacter tagetidis]